jgi:deoxyribodipyrimidine photo-lyase
MSNKTILVWFRNDLRVNDNEILLEATRKADKVLPVYIFDPYYFTITEAGVPKTGNIRAQFLLESVANLRQNLQALGGDLIVRVGNPAELIPQLAQEYQVNEVYHHREVSFEETKISEELEAALWKIKLNLKHFIGHTLYHKEDLPFPIKDIPDSFAVFKKKVERDSDVRPCVQTPEHIELPENAEPGEIPTLQQLGLEEPVADTRARFTFTGGETAGTGQLQRYINNALAMMGSKPVRNGMQTYVSGISPWLALGCLSPRQVYWSVMQHFHHNNNPLVLELLWRDYFRFMFKKHGSNKFFNAEGFKTEAPEVAPKQDDLFENWKHGATGNAAIDAAMTELNHTGFINNYTRQALATYLIKELKVDWTRGALYFESVLIDYSPASNWGNWIFVAGVGNDPRENKYFDTSKLNAECKDDYLALWLSHTKDVA